MTIRAQVYLVTGKWSNEKVPTSVQAVSAPDVPEFVRTQLADPLIRSVIVQACNGHQRIWTYEWKDVTL